MYDFGGYYPVEESSRLHFRVCTTNVVCGLLGCLEFFVFGNCKWFLCFWAAILWALLWVEVVLPVFGVLPDVFPDEVVLPVADEVVWLNIDSLALVAGVE